MNDLKHTLASGGDDASALIRKYTHRIFALEAQRFLLTLCSIALAAVLGWSRLRIHPGDQVYVYVWVAVGLSAMGALVIVCVKISDVRSIEEKKKLFMVEAHGAAAEFCAQSGCGLAGLQHEMELIAEVCDRRNSFDPEVETAAKIAFLTNRPLDFVHCCALAYVSDRWENDPERIRVEKVCRAPDEKRAYDFDRCVREAFYRDIGLNEISRGVLVAMVIIIIMFGPSF